MGGVVLYVADKKAFMTVNGTSETNCCVKNAYSGKDDIIDYKDWSVGFGRRSKAFEMYLTLHMLGTFKYE